MIMDLGNLLQKLFKMWVLFSSCEVISEQYMIMCKLRALCGKIREIAP